MTIKDDKEEYRLLQSPCFEEVALVGAASVPLRHIFGVRCQIVAVMLLTPDT